MTTTVPSTRPAAVTPPDLAATGDQSLTPLPGWRRQGTQVGTLVDCSLVVPTYRRPSDIVTLLDRLAALPDRPGEVVVVDGSPDDLTTNAVQVWSDGGAHPFDLLVVRSAPGLTRQRNVGIDLSRGDFVFYLDDDCLPEPGYFRAMRDVFVADVERTVGAVGGSLVNEMGRPLDLRWRLRFLLRLVPRGESGTFFRTATSIPRSTVARFTGTRAVDMLPGGASAYRRALLERHRFSLFFSGYAQGEDLEMSRRIAREWDLRWCGDAHVLHYHAPGGRPPSVEKGIMEVRNRFFIWKRYVPDTTVGDALRFWADIAFIFAVDVATFLARPRDHHHLVHAAGVALGAYRCIVDPPRHDEPPPRREYAVTTDTR